MAGAPTTKLPRGSGPAKDRPATKAEEAHLRGESAKRNKAAQAEYERGRRDGAAGRHQPPFDDADNPDGATAYQAGYDEARSEKRRTSTADGSSSSSKGKGGGRGGGKPKSGGSSRRPAGRASSAARRSTRTAARRTLAPVRSSANGALTVIGGGVLLAVAYQALASADAAAGLLGGLNKALIWLREPVPIPYRHPR